MSLWRSEFEFRSLASNLGGRLETPRVPRPSVPLLGFAETPWVSAVNKSSDRGKIPSGLTAVLAAASLASLLIAATPCGTARRLNRRFPSRAL